MRGDGPVVVGATVTQQAAQAVRLQEGGGGSPWLFCDGGRIRPTLCRDVGGKLLQTKRAWRS